MLTATSKKRVFEFGPLLILGAVLSCIPYLLIYLKNLWELPHYQFFPLLVAAVAYLGWQRWGGRLDAGQTVAERAFRIGLGILFAGGFFGLSCGTLFASPWMSYFGFACCLASWLGHHRDRESGKSLIYLALPVLLIWQPPLSRTQTGDTLMIQQLQSVSAKLSSRWLDALGYTHFQPGTVLQFEGKSFGVAEACSGIQSFFAVLCVGALLVVVHRRGAIHSALLLATSPFWAVLMNTIRITLIPIAYSSFGIDLSHGLLHDLLGFATMGLAIALMLSSDELILACLQLAGDHLGFGSTAKSIMTTSDGKAAKTSEFSQPSVAYLVAALPIIGLLLLVFGIQGFDTISSWNIQRKSIDFFRDEPLLALSSNDLPKDLSGWPRVYYDQENRERGNDDLGQRSDLWYYQAPFGRVSVSFDQMFPGWHELTRCYRSAGWKLDNRRVLAETASGEWPIVMAEFSRPNEHGYLLWSLVNRSGKYEKPPGEWNKWSSLKERLQNRLSPAVRSSLFGIAAYQSQIFVPSAWPINEEEREEVLERFLITRKLMWESARKSIEDQSR